MLWVILYATLFSLVHADGHDRTGATGVLSHLGRSTGGPGWRPIEGGTGVVRGPPEPPPTPPPTQPPTSPPQGRVLL